MLLDKRGQQRSFLKEVGFLMCCEGWMECWKLGKASQVQGKYTKVCCKVYASMSGPDGNCSHEIKRQLLLGRKVMTNLDSILKSRDITLPAKVCLVKAMAFL